MSVNADAPPIRPPRVSIVSSAEIISPPRGGTGDDGTKWMGGIHVLPLSARDTSGTFPICPSDASKDASNRVDEQQFDAFSVYAVDDCSTFGSGDVDFVQRAQDKLRAIEPWWIERVLWENPDDLPNSPAFVDGPSTILTQNDDPLGAFIEVDSAVATDTHDGRGMVHMTTKMFDALQQYDLFRREGNIWLSPLDNIVVPGRGYTGNGPNEDGGAEENPATSTVHWMYGHSGVVQLVRGDVLTFGDGNSELKRYTNDKWVVAERGVAIMLSNASGDGNVTGFYAASGDMSLVPGASGSSALTVATPVASDDTGYAAATAYLGYSLYNDSGSDATVIIYEGADNTGAILDVVSLVDGESAREWYDPGIVVDGIYVDVTVGAINANSTIRYKS